MKEGIIMATRFQFYPSNDLENKLTAKAKHLGIPISQLIIDILESIDIDSYCLQPNSAASYLSAVVLEMIAYASTKPKGYTFPIREASNTFSEIPATFLSSSGVRPSPVRAKLGTLIYKQIDAGGISQISLYKCNGELQSDNMGALLYEVK